MKKSLLLIALLVTSKISFGQVNWAEQIAPIVYGQCSHCHNINGIAPFELMNYNDAVQNGTDIKDQVTTKAMPPWPPDPQYSHLAYERLLTQQQINDISDWVDNGMPRGDSTLEPPSPVFNNIAEIANPDLILPAPVYNVNTTDDLYQCFVIPSGLSVDKYLTGIEAVPGNRAVVHHILIYTDTSNTPAQLDAADPAPGYTNFGGTGSPSSKLIGVWVPGQRAYFTPAGMGIKLSANTNIVMQIHYPGGITGQTDSTKLFLKLTPNFMREVSIESPLNHYLLDNGPLIIPANQVRTFNAHYVIPYDLSVLGVGPHMHLIGTSILSFGITPAQDTIPFIDIPHWDFHWQGVYSFPTVIKLPQGTTIYSEATYDNTSANPENPNNPPQLVHLGESTTDEMMLVYFSYTFYLPGDENIIIDSSQISTGTFDMHSSVISTVQLYEPTPNPANEKILFQYYLPNQEALNISITDINGRKIIEENQAGKPGLTNNQIDVSKLSDGIYFLNLKSNNTIRTKKFIKQ